MDVLRARLAVLESGEQSGAVVSRPTDGLVGLRTAHDAAAAGDVDGLRARLGSHAGSTDERQYGPSRMGGTVLHAASTQPLADVVNVVLSQRCDARATDRLGRSALHTAAVHGHAEVAETLLAQQPALLHGTTSSGATPLHEACYHGHAAVVDILCCAHADINACDAIGRLPLHWAAERGHAEATTVLLSHAMRMKHSLDPVNAVDHLRRSSLHLSCLNGHPDVAGVLVAYGADINATDSVGYSPMELAGMNHEMGRDRTRGDGSQAQNAVLNIDITEPSRTGRLHEQSIVKPPRGRTPLNVGRQRTDVTHDRRAHVREEHPDTVAARGHLGCVSLLLKSGARPPA
eukprot:COSAG02_NODE_1995_length_10156_cov_54.624242_2_plen_346_part_00